jgi:ATP-binding cassette, subfamily B, bacterial
MLFYKQQYAMDCGPTCLRMVAKHYKKSLNIETIRQHCQIGKDGVNLLGIANAAEAIGFRARAVKLTYQQLIEEAPHPCILHWDQNHFVASLPTNEGFLKKISNFIQPIFKSSNSFKIADPAHGIITISKKELLQKWATTTLDGEAAGIALLLEPRASFYEAPFNSLKVGETSHWKNKTQSPLSKSPSIEGVGEAGWSLIIPYFIAQRKFLWQLVLGLVAGSILQLIFPFLTQGIVDIGIQTHNLPFIYMVLIAQLMLSVGSLFINFVRSKLLLYISTRINVSILSDFWIKLMKLPLSFFDSKLTGDIIQRLGDHKRIQSFLTGSALNTFFSLFNFVVFSFVILQYSPMIFAIFCVGSLIYFLWISLFLKYRKQLDYQYFAIASKENTATMQLIHGMQEIRLNNAEQFRRWEWESLQTQLFKLQFKSLNINQIQQSGAFFINQAKNIVISFLVAKSVMDGQITLGAMLAIQSIIGQLNSPIEQLISFVQQAQDAKISLERLNEIHSLQNETQLVTNNNIGTANYIDKIDVSGISISNLSFTYQGAGNEPVLNNINLQIPKGKVTAIVGTSGSGKTTLLKLLQKFYFNYEGKIEFENTQQVLGNWKEIDPNLWRKSCGCVMQDGFIFNDNIANNIAASDGNPNYEKLIHACKVANILEFVQSLPLGFNTKIGAEGNGISQGQKQRILIARAVYKNPSFLFFDEATNALDANNEKEIMQQLDNFFNGKTVVVVAHRLSTVKNADNIIVLKNGVITQQGKHEELVAAKGDYFELVKNQLELGS